MKNAYTYARTYAGEPAEEEVVAQQLATIRRYAHEQGIEIVGEYSDLNADASNEMSHIYGLHEMMEDAIQSKVNCVIVEQSVTIAHDDATRAVLLAILDGGGFRVLSALDGTNLTASEDHVLSLASEFYPAYMEFRKSWRPVVANCCAAV